MTLECLIARPLMRLAAMFAPAQRAEWRVAMEQEFEALEGGEGSLGWAAGCLAASVGWRARAESGFALFLVAAVLIATWLNTAAFFILVHLAKGWSWLGAYDAVQHVLLGAICFILAILWRRCAAIIGIVVPLTVSSGAMVSFFVTILVPEGAFPTLQSMGYGLLFLAMQMWSSGLGAALGWAITRRRGTGTRETVGR